MITIRFIVIISDKYQPFCKPIRKIPYKVFHRLYPSSGSYPTLCEIGTMYLRNCFGKFITIHSVPLNNCTIHSLSK
uniref:Uncharacterized protein n=1 Tax=Pararge aegeria TaxID=116150 RepID=S4P362_9NEOP